MTRTAARLTALVAIQCICLTLIASAAAAEKTYDFQQRTLPNGLKVVTLEDFSCPIVAVQVWYHVGSKHEDPQRQGFAHMFEHMMFRGTDRLGPEDHFKYVRGTGGDCNAYTAFDNTTYINELPANQLELALWLEAERMTFLKIDDESFSTERKVVEEERRLGLNRPYGTVLEKVLPVVIKEHPYRWSPIGQIPHLRAATITELEAFWSKFYVPNNATLVIVGAVKHDDAQKLAEKYFGWIPKCPDPPVKLKPEPPQTAARECKVAEEKGPAPIIGYLYRGLPENSPDQTALEVLFNILGGGQSSRLYRDLVKEQKLCQFALGGSFSLQDDGFAGVGAVLMPWGNKEKTFKALDAHIEKVRDEPVTERELTKVKNQLLREVVTGALSVANKARLLGEADLVYGDAGHVNQRIDEIRSVTVADIQRVAQMYLTPERRTTVRVEPSIGGMLKGLLGLKGPTEDEGAAPASQSAGSNQIAARTGGKAAAARPDWFPAKPPAQPVLESIPAVESVEKTLANGLKVVVVPNYEIPYVTMTLGLKYGAWAEDPAKPGVASMTLGMLTQGTKKHTAVELAEEIEFNALTLSGGASLDVANVTATCLSDKIDVAGRLLAEVVLEPTFPADEFKVQQQQAVLSLMIASKEPAYLADRELRRRMYGDHPYARTATGEVDDVRRIKPQDLESWWKAFARPDMAVLYVAGDVKADQVFALAERELGGWKSDASAPQPSMAQIPAAGKQHIYLVDRPGSVQSQIRVGHGGIQRDHPDYFASRVMSQIFGGAFDSRLNKAVRVEKGLTYGAGGGMSAQRFAGEFRASTFSKTPKTAEALQVLLGVIDRMKTDAPTDEELATTKNYLAGSFAGDRETPQAIVNDLWLIEYCKLPKDYFQQALTAYKKTGSADVQRLAQDHLKPGELTIVVVGDAEKVKKDLEAIAPVTVVKPKDDKPSEEAKPSQG